MHLFLHSSKILTKFDRDLIATITVVKFKRNDFTNLFRVIIVSSAPAFEDYQGFCPSSLNKKSAKDRGTFYEALTVIVKSHSVSR